MPRKAREKKVKSPEVYLFLIIKAHLRRIFGRSPAHYAAMNRVKRTTYVGKDKMVFFRCACCGCEFMRKDIQIDHIEPVIPIDRSVISYDELVKRLFVSADGLQVLCKPCHKNKSKEENSERRDARAQAQDKEC